MIYMIYMIYMINIIYESKFQKLYLFITHLGD